MSEPSKIEETPVDNSVPYPEAPKVDPNNSNQQCYRGSRNTAETRVRRQPQPFPGRAGNYPDRE